MLRLHTIHNILRAARAESTDISTLISLQNVSLGHSKPILVVPDQYLQNRYISETTHPEKSTDIDPRASTAEDSPALGARAQLYKSWRQRKDEQRLQELEDPVVPTSSAPQHHSLKSGQSGSKHSLSNEADRCSTRISVITCSV